MTRMRFEPMITVLYETRILSASDRSATVIGPRYYYERKTIISRVCLHGKL
jgi:hypothetical protein